MMKGDIQNTLRSLHHVPNQRMGQNFLHDERVADTIIDLLGDDSPKLLVEVGPGLGAITRELAKKADRVIAIERDETLARHLQTTLQEEGIQNVEVIVEDAREYNFDALKEPYAFVSNLPFSTGTYILRRVLETAHAPEVSIVIMQKEVGERIIVKKDRWSLLALAVHLVAVPEYVQTIPASAYDPQPNVDTALLRIHKRKEIEIELSKDEKELFFRLAKWGFSSKRKQLANTLSAGMNVDQESVRGLLQKAEIDPTIRAERLEPQDWKRIVEMYQKQDTEM